MENHPLRGTVLNELHARPFLPASAPLRLIHFAFMTDAAQAAADRERLHDFCRRNDVPGPAAGAKHFHVDLVGVRLRWEQHSEFTTYTWEIAGSPDTPFEPATAEPSRRMLELSPPDPLIVAADLHLMTMHEPIPRLENLFDPSSLAAARVHDGAAIIATDFQASSDGFTRLLVLNRTLPERRAGALVQRLLEIETYRTLALLGLPEAQRVAPSVRRIETALVRIARTMTDDAIPSKDDELLDELTRLAAELEADATDSGFRFNASRAYDDIVLDRLRTIGEEPLEGHSTIASFLTRRMSPAMRTCQIMEERQANLSRKLTRAANLLRTRVDVAIEQQNTALLHTMNERTRLQLRLQQTVEGLSIAAISYYVVGLAGYVLKGAYDVGLPINPGVGTAVSVPVAIAGVAWIVLRIRRGHAEHDVSKDRKPQ